MSRCFPFPRPNYHKEERILTESIKLRKEQEASKDKRKEKRRDKKEKRERSRDKKENPKDSERAHKKRKHNEANEPHMKDAYQIAAAAAAKLHAKDVATEPLERSGLTEEHGPPCRTPEPCESSESTQTSSKGRKLETVSQHGTTTTIIRFKLKRKDPKPAAIVGEEPCFSGRATSKDPEPVPTGVDEPCFSGRATAKTPIEMQGCVAETPVEMQVGESSKSHRKRRGKERMFRDVINNWKPAPLLAGDDGVGDLGWLLDGPWRNRASSEAKRCDSSEDLSGGSAACSFQPRACYLPELETYRLPYVIPF